MKGVGDIRQLANQYLRQKSTLDKQLARFLSRYPEFKQRKAWTPITFKNFWRVLGRGCPDFFGLFVIKSYYDGNLYELHSPEQLNPIKVGL